MRVGIAVLVDTSLTVLDRLPGNAIRTMRDRKQAAAP
jgi:hypothetical protein